MSIVADNIVIPVVDYSVRGLCAREYYGHKKGCPNFFNPKKKQCPPHGPKIEDLIDLDKNVYCIYNRFNFGEHVKRMYQEHPNWSQRQAECCLYWQGTARKRLKIKIVAFIKQHKSDDLVLVDCPEGCGVNVTKTMKQLGIKLEWPPIRYAYQVVLIGHKIEGEKYE